ncbi:MAG: hypothetical protein NTY19_19035, partial [Planctomycetota bacterium]|nr:hypothetical protein [Planctomycetota bacterium]
APQPRAASNGRFLDGNQGHGRESRACRSISTGATLGRISTPISTTATIGDATTGRVQRPLPGRQPGPRPRVEGLQVDQHRGHAGQDLQTDQHHGHDRHRNHGPRPTAASWTAPRWMARQPATAAKWYQIILVRDPLQASLPDFGE